MTTTQPDDPPSDDLELATGEPGEPTGLARTLATIRDRWREIAESAQIAFARVPPGDLARRDLPRVRADIQACLDGIGGEVSSRARAASLGRIYLDLNDDGKKQFLELLARPLPDRALVEALAHELALAGDADYDAKIAALRAAVQPPAHRLFAQFNSLPAGIKFLVDLRADLLRLAEGSGPLRRLERELRDQLAAWFDIGFLDLQRITWDAPASLLERLASYEAVHEIRNWRDLKNRLDTDRRCYAFFHPLMPDEPLIFLEVALLSELAASIQPLLDTAAPLENPREASTAIFYSISNCQRGLAGISFGNALIKRVATDLSRELPQLKTFATLSPIPGFRSWLAKHEGADSPLAATLARRGWQRDPTVSAAVETPLMRLCAHYLAVEKRRGGEARDPVAHFHLLNGARIERLDWLGDRSPKGLRESAGMMVNYLYKLDQIDENHEAYTSGGKIAVSNAIRTLLR
ncbi:MAG: malonyl-CoA decarboxylase family protein [Candidatus Velthaea sp.]|jgi:malonyl-CoA decarboxylase